MACAARVAGASRASGALLCRGTGRGLPAAVRRAASSWQRPVPPAWAAPASDLRASLLLRRGYLDSVDRTVTVRSMEDPAEVLQFMAENSDSDTRTYEAALRTLSKRVNNSNYQQVVNDGRFHTILSALATRLDDVDVRMLSMIADATARFRSSTPELSDLAQRLAEVVVRREDAFNPRNLASVALALSVRSVRDTATIEFVRSEAMKLMDDFEPTQCVILLEAFRRWGVFDKELVDLIVERMSDEVDRFTARDVVDALAVASRIGLARGFLLRRLCSLSFENLRQFMPRELTKMGYSLAKLRFLTRTDLDDLVDAITPDLARLQGSQVSELLYTLAMVDARHQLELGRTLVAQYFDSPSAVKSKSLSSLIDVAWSLCSLGLIEEFSDDFKALLEEVFDRSPPQNRVPLLKLFDVLCALELEYKHLGVAVPQIWKAACDDADRFEMDKLESSRLHNEIVMRFDHLRGVTKGLRWQLRMQRSQQCGPYRVDMLDEDTKIALDIETIIWPCNRTMKHRLISNLGFKPIRLEYWEWRRARSEEDQNVFLEREVNRLLESSE